ncbi:MAG: hypothetical protein WA130_18190 [Candidatus Methanoperedens sp.]
MALLMGLLKFEFRKFVIKPYVLILIIACTAADLVGVFFSCDEYKNWYNQDGFQKVYNSKLAGELSEDKIDYVIAEDERLTNLVQDGTFSQEHDSATITGYIFGDWVLFHDNIKPQMEYAVGYAYDINRIVGNAKENLAFFEEQQAPYELKKNQQILSLYSNRTIHEFYDLMGMKYYLHYDFSSLLVLLLCILIIVPVFVGEKETKMDQLLPAYKNGRKKLVRTKIIFTYTIVLFLSLWFLIWDLIGFALFSPFRGFGAPLYAVQVFGYTPLNLKIWQYILLSFLLRTLGMSSLVGLILLASKIFSKTIYAFAISTGVILIPFMSQFVAKDQFTFLELTNPALLIKNRYLFMEYTAQKFFGNPISAAIPAVIANIIWISIGVVLVLQLSTDSKSLRADFSKARR